MPVEVIHSSSQVAPSKAWAALRDLIERGAPDDRGRVNAAVLSAVLDELASVRTRVKVERSYCAHCSESLLSPIEANEHTSACPSHPALVRLRAVRRAFVMAPAITDNLGLTRTPVDPAVLAAIDKVVAEAPASPKRTRFLETDTMLKQRLEFVVGDGRRKYPSLLSQYAAALEVAVTVWQRLFHRDTDPCPHCGAVTRLEDAGKHALNCEHHPAVAPFKRAEVRLKELLGADGTRVLLAQVEERNRFLDQLRILVGACDYFDQEMGWNGEECYVHDYLEAALGRARSAAGELVGLLPREYRPSFDPVVQAAAGPEFARPVWQALVRVREAGQIPGTHRGSPFDEKLLRDAVTEGGRLEASLGSEFVCPACMRPGLWAHQMAPHIPACPFHPAVLRERIIEASATLAFSVLREKRPDLAFPKFEAQELPKIGRFWPSARTWGKRQLDECEDEAHLKFLLTPEKRAKYPTIVRKYADDVASLLSTWQRYRTALTSECPYCNCSLRGFDAFPHMAKCEAHPAHARADALEEVLHELGVSELRGIARLRQETDLARAHIVRLAEFIESFTGSFGDDDRGRGIVHKELLPKWIEARQVAKAALEGLTPSPSGAAHGA